MFYYRNEFFLMRLLIFRNENDAVCLEHCCVTFLFVTLACLEGGVSIALCVENTRVHVMLS